MFKIGDKVQFVPGQTIRDGGRNEERARECRLEMDATYEIEHIYCVEGCVIIKGNAIDMRRIEHVGGPW